MGALETKEVGIAQPSCTRRNRPLCALVAKSMPLRSLTRLRTALLSRFPRCPLRATLLMVARTPRVPRWGALFTGRPRPRFLSLLRAALRISFHAVRRTSSKAAVARLTTWNGSAQRTGLAQDTAITAAIHLAASTDLVRVLIEAGLEVAGSYPDAESLLAELERKSPDLVVLDVRMPPTFRDEGVRAAIRARVLMPRLGILLLSQCVEIAYAQELLSSGTGGIGHLLKDRVASLAELEEAIERIASGGTVLDPEVVAQLLGRRRDPLGSLTPREREVLTHMAEGRTNAAIATVMVVGAGAVEKNVTSIFQKLGLDDSGNDHRRVLAVLAWLQR